MNNFFDVCDINNLTFSLDKLTINNILDLNRITSRRGLSLSYSFIVNLIESKNLILAELGRVEVHGILDKIIYYFYDSFYIDKDNYFDIINQLVRVFYYYQDEFDYRLSDEEILKYLRKSFDFFCGGSIYLLRTLSFEKLRLILDGDIDE